MSNSTALVGEDGVLLIDSGGKTEDAPLLQAAISTLSSKPVRLLVNTHWHYDHVNGNAFFGNRGAVLIGQTQMRQRVFSQKALMTGDTPLTGSALPVIVFEKELTLRFDGEQVLLRHPATGAAHTDGDLVVYFKNANVVATGDLYFNGLYPYIDVDNCGSIDGMIAGCREILSLIDGDTKVVPGHGPVSNKAAFQAYVDMLVDISARVTPMVRAGRTLAEVQAAKPTAAYDAAWGKLWLSGDQFVELVYKGVPRQAKQ
jgi:glyoxylase-like metal-dependent hydrolase (beta-lactamase superfamily II)